MWVSRSKEWHKSHSLITKYFVELIIQQVDYDENISNRHRTVNAPILINEIIDLCRLILLRQKSISRLKSTLEECVETKLNSSLVNDYIIKEYFKDVIIYFKNLDPKTLQNGKKINEKAIKDLSTRCKVFKKRLESFYYESISKELEKIDLDDSKFRRNSVKVKSIVTCLIPYLLYNGYSPNSISEVAIKFTKQNSPKVFSKFLEYFNFEKRDFTFLINIGKDVKEYETFVEQLDRIGYKYTLLDSVKLDLKQFIITPEFEDGDKFVEIKYATIDPHSFLATLYDSTLKYNVIGKNRVSLQFYTIYFKYVYWKWNMRGFKYSTSNISLDPLNTPKRRSTLRTTLRKLAPNNGFEFNDNTELPYLESIEQSVYFYNLALGSKSIENSMSLLWTSLESLVPYHPFPNDIDNIQHFVSKFLSIGAVGRELHSFTLRYISGNGQNGSALKKYDTRKFASIDSKEGLIEWLNWLTNNHYIPDSDTDPFNDINSVSVLLCDKFCHINEKWGAIYDDKKKDFIKGKVDEWQERIERSKLSIIYQLDRIYLYRNQIVHSGKFINEYSNLWSHLEWYVGKLLAYCYLQYYLNQETTFNKVETFYKLEGEVEHTLDQIKNYKEKNIIDCKDLHETIFRQTWQII